VNRFKSIYLAILIMRCENPRSLIWQARARRTSGRSNKQLPSLWFLFNIQSRMRLQLCYGSRPQKFLRWGFFSRHASRLQCYRLLFKYINVSLLILLRFGVSCLQVLQLHTVGFRLSSQHFAWMVFRAEQGCLVFRSSGGL